MKEPTQQLFNTMAREMFEAYNDHADGKTHDGKEIPPWHDISEKVQSHWLSAAKAAYDVILSYENHNSRESSFVVVSKSERLRQIEESLKNSKPFYAR